MERQSSALTERGFAASGRNIDLNAADEGVGKVAYTRGEPLAGERDRLGKMGVLQASLGLALLLAYY